MKRIEILQIIINKLCDQGIDEDVSFYDINITIDAIHLQGNYHPHLILALRKAFDLEEECDEIGHFIMTGTIHDENDVYLLIFCLT